VQRIHFVGQFQSASAGESAERFAAGRNGSASEPERIRQVRPGSVAFSACVEAPRDAESHGDWYVGWRDNDLKKTQALTLSQLLWGRWRQARDRAPSLARATHEAFGVYPLMIEPN